MGVLITVLIAGFLGVLGHWAVRWKQGRTESTFVEYLKNDIGGTISSFSANITSSLAIYSAIPDDATAKVIALGILTAYTTSYMADSAFNKDSKPALPEAKETKPAQTIQEAKHEDAHKSINDLLDSDD